MSLRLGHILPPHISFHGVNRTQKVLSFVKNWTLPIAILAGILSYFIYVNIPWLEGTHSIANRLVGIVQPVLIFSMLFLTFLTIGPHDLHLRKWHLWHVIIQTGAFIGLTLLLVYIADSSWRIIAESVMLCLICPTATAAAVVTRKLDGNSADITTYTIIINLAIAMVAPVLLPIAHPHEGLSFFPTFIRIVGKVFPMLICPLLAAWIIRRWVPTLKSRLLKYRDLPFYLWAVALSIAIAVTVKAIVHSNIAPAYLIGIAIASLICCLLQFIVGKSIGYVYGESIEGGQALGQKNTVFIIWLGYTFLSPVTAVAGGIYSIWHNIFNSYQLYKKRVSGK